MPMSIQHLTNVVIPELQETYGYLFDPTKNIWLATGVASEDPTVYGLMKTDTAAGAICMPAWSPNVYREASVGSVDSTKKIEYQTIDSTSDLAMKSILTTAYKLSEVERIMVGNRNDPIGALINNMNANWDRERNNRMFAVVLGVIANSKTLTGELKDDLILNHALTSAGTPTIDNMLTRTSILDAKAALGDQTQALPIVVMHPTLWYSLRKQNDKQIDMRPSDIYTGFQTFEDMFVYVSEDCPVVINETTSQKEFTTYFLGRDIIAYNEAPTNVPFEIGRDAAGGNGAGIDMFYTRRQNLVHPHGFSIKQDTFTGKEAGFTITQLKTADTWSRSKAVTRKHLKFVALITNG